MSRSFVEKVIKLCESRGFSVESRIEGSFGTAYIYHFGPLGTELRRNLRNTWWNDVVRSKGNVYGFETANELITQATGQSPTTTNSKRATPLSEKTNNVTQLFRFIPGISVPFGVAWNRKSFRKPENDNYILRSCEREVMSLEFVCAENRVNDWTNHWKRQRLVWWRKFANVRSNYSIYEEQADLEPGLHNQTLIQYSFPWGKESVDTMTVRSDLCKHLTDEEYGDLPFSKDSIPYVIQIKTDLNTGFLSLLLDAYQEKERSDSSGKVNLCTVLYLHPQLAPIKVAVLSQIPQQNELCELAQQLSFELREAGITTQCPLHASADECYAYQDEVGTPYCITVLDTTLTNGIVMFRSRNTTLQEYMHISDILSTVKSHIGLKVHV